MAFPKRVCVICSEEFELRPDKPGFANRCPVCSEQEPAEGETKHETTARDNNKELNQARRKAMRDLLYRKDM